MKKFQKNIKKNLHNSKIYINFATSKLSKTIKKHFNYEQDF